MWLRSFGLVALVCGALVALTPTLAPALAPEVLAGRRLHLGVDLQGGAEIVWEVVPQTAVDAEIGADAAWLHDRTGAEVRATRAGLEIRSDQPADDVVRWVAPLGAYEPAGADGGVHGFRLTDEWRARLEESAVARTAEGLRERVGCVEGATVERRGARLVALALPGEGWPCLGLPGGSL